METGILDYLRQKNPTNSKLKIAQILAPILNEKSGTIQSIINAIINKNISKNNPYKNFSKEGENKKINRVREKLIDLGITPNSHKYSQNLEKTNS